MTVRNINPSSTRLKTIVPLFITGLVLIFSICQLSKTAMAATGLNIQSVMADANLPSGPFPLSSVEVPKVKDISMCQYKVRQFQARN